jgi:(p)ppGpp synthase/HD superfamily hydrolase
MADHVEPAGHDKAPAGQFSAREASLLGRADQVAARAHEGQTDKSGVPYIEHPRRVASRLSSPEEKMVALLHDVVEDTHLRLEDLRAEGFPAEVVDAVDRLTRRKDQSAEDYLAGIVRSNLAVAVKRADIADNADPERLARLPDVEMRDRLTEKYRHALEVLDHLCSENRG